jgi:hypothetical protein
MNDEELDRRLRELDGDGCAPGFTERVLAKIAAPPPRSSVPQLVAALLVFALATAGTLRLLRTPARRPSVASARAVQLEAELAALRAERDQLRRALDRLQRDARPVLYLDGNDDRVDVVLDVRHVELALDPVER